MIRKFLKFTGIALALGIMVVSCAKEDTEIVDTDASFQMVNMEELTDNLAAIEGASVHIPGQYIIVYNTDITGDFGAGRTNYQASKEAVIALTNDILGNTRSSQNEIIHVYSKSINGATIRLSNSQVASLKKDSRVALVEQDRIVQFAPPCGTPNGGPCDPGTGGGGGSGS